MNLLRNPFLRPLEYDLTLPELVRRSRHLSILLIFMITFSMALATLIYLMLIWPYFIAPDFSNSAVQEAIFSEPHKQRVEGFFSELRDYNARAEERFSTRPNDFVFMDPAWKGLVVVGQYSLKSRGPGDLNNHGLVQYKYESSFQLRLDPRYLIPYVLAMLVGVTCAMYWLVRMYVDWRDEERLMEKYDRLEHDRPQMSAAASAEEPIDLLLSMLPRFQYFVTQLGRRHANRKAMNFVDEYDVQDAMHAILIMMFSDVRSEEYTPSYAGKSSRIDFLLSRGEVALEVKMTRPGLLDKQLGDELIIDVKRYQNHPRCQTLVCFIFDPGRLLVNPGALVNDLAQDGGNGGLNVKVVVSR